MGTVGDEMKLPEKDIPKRPYKKCSKNRMGRGQELVRR